MMMMWYQCVRVTGPSYLYFPKPVSLLHCGLFSVSTHLTCPLLSLSQSWGSGTCSITGLIQLWARKQQSDHNPGLSAARSLSVWVWNWCVFSRSDQLWGGVSLPGQRNREMFQSILKWNKLAPYLYNDSSPAVAGPAVVVWVCVLQGSCLSCPGVAPGSILGAGFGFF